MWEGGGRNIIEREWVSPRLDALADLRKLRKNSAKGKGSSVSRAQFRGLLIAVVFDPRHSHHEGGKAQTIQKGIGEVIDEMKRLLDECPSPRKEVQDPITPATSLHPEL